jgi:hypothetical protein
MVAFQVILLCVSYFIHQNGPQDFHLTDQVLMLPFVGALICFVLGFVLPKKLLGRVKLPGAGTSHPLSAVISPYLIRLCLFELCSVIGFVGAFLLRDWHVMLPFAALGLVGTAASVPTAAFFERLKAD